jgi:hypothetical protein
METLPKEVISIIKELAAPRFWLYIYPEGHLLIEADNKENAIWKLKLKADPYIGYRDRSPMNDAYGLNFLFHADVFDYEGLYNFNNYNFYEATKEELAKAFESEIQKRHELYGEKYEFREVNREEIVK